MNIALVTAALNFFSSLKREPKAHLLNSDTAKGTGGLIALFVLLGFTPFDATQLDQILAGLFLGFSQLIDIFRRRYAAAVEAQK